MKKIAVFGLFLALGAASKLHAETKATECSGDATLLASLAYKIADPKAYTLDSQTSGNPKLKLENFSPQSAIETWSITWKGANNSGIQYKVEVEPIWIKDQFYSCNVRKLEISKQQ